MSGGADSEVTVTRTVPQLPVATDGIGTGKFLTESGLQCVRGDETGLAGGELVTDARYARLVNLRLLTCKNDRTHRRLRIQVGRLRL